MQRLRAAGRYWLKKGREKVVFAGRPCVRGTAVHLDIRFLEMLPGVSTLTYFPAVLC